MVTLAALASVGSATGVSRRLKARPSETNTDLNKITSKVKQHCNAVGGPSVGQIGVTSD